MILEKIEYLYVNFKIFQTEKNLHFLIINLVEKSAQFL